MSPDDARAVCVTGLGAISPLGANLEASWQACFEGRSAIAPHRFDTGDYGPPPFEVPLALVAQSPEPEIERRLGRRLGTALDPFALYALGAATEAIAQAGLTTAMLSSAGVVFGHGSGGVHSTEQGYERFYGRRTNKQHPMTVPRSMVSSPVSAIAMECGIRGPVFAVSSACSSSGHAMIQGAMMLRAGQASVVLVGGSDAIATPACIAAWEGLRAMSKTTCRPFSANRDGMAIGEGGACLVLETRAHAEARGATILAVLAGTGMSSDAFHWTQPSLEGPVSCIRQACTEAGVIDASGMLIAAHGTGTPVNDSNETKALNAVFSSRAQSHHVTATKSAHGHLIGASTALQAALGLKSLAMHQALPILGFLGRDPECDLNLVLERPRPVETTLLLVSSFAFGGLNTSLVFRAYARQ